MRWARRVFTRLEWPHLSQKFLEAGAQRPPSEILVAQHWSPKVEHTTNRKQRTHPASSPTEALLLQAETAQHEAEPHHEMQNTGATINGELPGNAHLRPLPPFRSPPTHDLSQLAQYLAGRWAAKEAAIKAHRYRRLYLSDISILHPALSGKEDSGGWSNRQKLHALIAPDPPFMVAMDSKVAKLRGLFERQTRFPNVYGTMIGGHLVRVPKPDNQNVSTAQNGRKFFVRGARVKDQEQQIAEISISHDHDYAVAVCMAIDERTRSRDTIEYIVDDGSGEPLHEPEWGDEGWLEIQDFSNGIR
ncbi:MAG: hypothetical protein Q9225_002844 [Loekoesia sp. 1 TL-2023]